MKKRWMNLFAVASFVLILGMVVSLLLAAGKSGIIKGKVTDQQSKKPVSGAVVKITGTGYSATTDSTGFFEISGISAGTYNLEIQANQYQLTKVEKIDIHQQTENILDIPISLLSIGKTAEKTVTPKDVVVGTKQITKTDNQDLKEIIDELKTEDSEKDLDGSKHLYAGRAASKAAQGRGVMAIAGSTGNGGAAGGMGSVSLGGSAGYLNPPNGAKYWDMYHNDYGTNPFIDTDDDHLSTFGADVST